jgi:hypothetical protein
VLTGAASERVEIAAAEVARLRLAEYPATASTRGHCEAGIARAGGPILLTANRDDDAYGATMRAFALAVVAANGAGVMRRGPGLGSAIVMMLLTIGSLTLLMLFLIALAALGGGWWWAAALLFAPLYLLVWRAQLHRQWPRRVHDPADLDIVLPPFTGAPR